MLSTYDLVEELAAIARDNSFEHQAPLAQVKGHVLCISGSYFLSKIMAQVQAGDLLTGISVKSLKTHIEKFKRDAEASGFKFKLIFNGPEIYLDKTHYNNACNIKKRFYHLLWKLEVMKSLASQKGESSDHKDLLQSINRVKQIIKDSLFFK